MMQCADADGIARIHLLINGEIINSLLLLNRLFCLVSATKRFSFDGFVINNGSTTKTRSSLNVEFSPYN